MENTAVKRKAMGMEPNSIANPRRSKRIRGGLSAPCLPNDLLLSILFKLPAKFLHDIAKFVCKTWGDIIRSDFSHEHLLLHSNEGFRFIFQDFLTGFYVRYVEAKEGKIIVTSRIKNHLPKGKYFASSDGLLLSQSNHDFYVSNCITKRAKKLPSFLLKTCEKTFFSHGSIAYIPRTRGIKVIFPCVNEKNTSGHFHVFTVGGGDDNNSPSWRTHNFGLSGGDYFSVTKPISINGVIYWVYQYPRGTMLAVDLCDVRFHYIKVPSEFLAKDNSLSSISRGFGFQKMGDYLSYTVWKKNHMEINVWILKDMYTSDWIKIRKIEFSDRLQLRGVHDHHHYLPIAWIDNAHVLLFYDTCRGYLVAYRLSNRSIKFVANFFLPQYTSEFLTHTHSLVSW